MFHCGQSSLATNVFIVLSRIIIIDPWQTLVPMDHDWLKDVEKVQASLHQNRKQQKVKKKKLNGMVMRGTSGGLLKKESSMKTSSYC